MSIYNNYLLTSFTPHIMGAYVLNTEDLDDFLRLSKRPVLFVTVSTKRRVASTVNEFIARMISQP